LPWVVAPVFFVVWGTPRPIKACISVDACPDILEMAVKN
jgi:hypothetical protein